jgi:hypothetical protein
MLLGVGVRGVLCAAAVCQRRARDFGLSAVAQGPRFQSLATAAVGGEHPAIVNGVHVTALFLTDRAVDVVARARSAAPVL